MNKKMAMVGLGYIGLPTAAVIAKAGWNVVGIDVKQSVVDRINAGEIHIVEAGLAEVVSDVVAEGKLVATSSYPSVNVYVVAVPTPTDAEHNADISFVESAMEQIAKVMPEGALVILESTSPVGTTEKMLSIFKHYHPEWVVGTHFNLAYCPERVLPGRVLHELLHNDRVIGGITPECTQKAKCFYETFVKATCHPTSARMAEMAKLTENAFRDVNIAFANELSLVCEKIGLDPFELINLANKHPRVNILRPGSGVGGHCIAVDPWFIVQAAPDEAKLIRKAREVNNHKPIHIFQKIRNETLSHPKGKEAKVAIVGLSFKPDIDDLRESPALEIAELLVEQPLVFGDVAVIEPNINQLPSSLSKNPNFSLQQLSVLEQCDIIAILVNHSQLKDLPWSEWHKTKVIIDAVGVGK